MSGNRSHFIWRPPLPAVGGSRPGGSAKANKESTDCPVAKLADPRSAMTVGYLLCVTSVAESLTGAAFLTVPSQTLWILFGRAGIDPFGSSAPRCSLSGWHAGRPVAMPAVTPHQVWSPHCCFMTSSPRFSFSMRDWLSD